MITFEEWLGNQLDERNEIYAEIGQECYDNGYEQGRADGVDELEQKLRVWDNKANAIPTYVWHCINEMKKQNIK